MGLQPKQSAESANVRQDFRTEGGSHQWCNTVDELVARIDIDSGISIGCHRRAHLSGGPLQRSTHEHQDYSRDDIRRCETDLGWKPDRSHRLLRRYNHRHTGRPFQRDSVCKSDLIDIDRSVVGESLAGLFVMLAKEERKTQTNPAARVTDLLKEVFAKTGSS